MTPRTPVLVAGIGGASLGTELLKCLRLADRYIVYGCDVSAQAYGLYDPGFERTWRIERNDYVSNVIETCRDAGAAWLIPGGEQPSALLGAAAARLAAAGIRLVANDPAVVASFSDKDVAFRRLAACGIDIPRTTSIAGRMDIESVGTPCIVKPATGTGGSASVFFATTVDEAMIYAGFIRRGGGTPIAQEYVDDSEGEFTIGVLSLPDGRLGGSIALRRTLDAKLSVAYRGRGGVISSGYSQGYIDAFPDLCHQAEQIADAIGSRGPINVQGRVRNGVLLPFEINPRFSASAYLRALAGFNEIDALVQHMQTGRLPEVGPIRPGWYLRSLTETFVSSEQSKS